MDIKDLLAQFDDMEAEDGMNIQESEEVNETKEFEDDKVKYVFTVTLIGKAEEEKSNAFYKENIKRALENELDKYDLKHLRSVAEKYSMDNVSNKAISIYESMLKDKNKAH